MAQNGGSPCPSRSRLGTADDGSSEYDQVAHVEPLLRRTEPGHPDAASAPALRRRNALYRRSDGPDLDARTDHACIIGISTAGRIVPRCQPSATLVRKPTGTTVLWGRVQVDADEHGDPADLADEARRQHEAAQLRGLLGGTAVVRRDRLLHVTSADYAAGAGDWGAGLALTLDRCVHCRAGRGGGVLRQ
jgi:hypothetical protein